MVSLVSNDKAYVCLFFLTTLDIFSSFFYKEEDFGQDGEVDDEDEDEDEEDDGMHSLTGF